MATRLRTTKLTISRREFLRDVSGSAMALGVGLPAAKVATGAPAWRANSSRPLVLWNWDPRPAWNQALNNLIADFTQETKIKVQVVQIPSTSLSEKLQTSAQSKTMPDLYYGGTDFPAYVQQGLLVSLSDVFKSIGADKFFPKMLTYSKWKGHYYSIPFINYPRVVWYRKDYLAKAGIKQPTNWAELLDAAKALNNPSSNQYGFINFNKYADQPPLCDLMITNNAVVINAKGKVAIDSPQTVEALTMIANLNKYSPPGTETKSQAEMSIPFGQGEGAFMITSTSRADVLASTNPANSTLYSAFPLPIRSGKRSGLMGVGSWWVTRDAEVAVAKRFLRFFFRDDVYTKFAQTTVAGHLPTLSSVAESKAYLNSPRVKPWVQTFKTANVVTQSGGLWGEEFGLNAEAAPILTARVATQMQDKVTIGNQSPKSVAAFAQQAAEQAVELSQ